MNNSEDITVSVCMITYNHEQYIAEAIHGVLMQETNFKVELILAEDCSPDNSQKVIQEILDTYKGEVLIRYTRHTENKGMMPNFIWALNQCKGKYIALCEGDDYWTDPLKLQKQVDFLEENENCVICFHDVNVLEKNGEIVEDYIAKPNYESIGKNKFSLTDLLEFGNCIHTPSVVFRSKYLIFPFEFHNSCIGDYILYVLLLQESGLLVGKQTFVGGAYRKGVGVFSSIQGVNSIIADVKQYNMIFSVLRDSSHKQILSKRYNKKYHDKDRLIENYVLKKLTVRDCLRLIMSRLLK